MITGLSAILLISPKPELLADFYRDTLLMPLIEEEHPGVPLHYACDLQDVHFAIHPAEGWPGTLKMDSQSPVIVLASDDVKAVARKLEEQGIEPNGPFDHGFAHTVSFRDPDGNHIEVLQKK